MKSIFRILGIILIITGLAAMAYGTYTFIVALTANPDVRANALCVSGETMIKTTVQLSSSTSHGNKYFCENTQGVRRDITDQVGESVVNGTLIFVGGLIAGMIAIGIGIALMLIKRQHQANPSVNVNWS